jgi:MoaA/NifB/PqqE/SkfB family radical SAM enzyme
MVSPRFAYSNLKDKLIGRKLVPFPRFLVLHLTNSCNMSCAMCSIAEARRAHIEAGTRQMPINLISRLADESFHHGGLVNLYGGEPLLYQDLDEALRIIGEHRLLSYLTTNGLLVDEKAESLVKRRLNILQISLDGWDEESQFKRGNVPGSFDAIASGIKHVLSLRGAGAFPIIRIATVVTRNNFHSLDKIQRLIHQWGVREWVINNYQFVTDQAVERHESFKNKTGIGDFIAGDRTGNQGYLSSGEIAGLKESLARVWSDQARLGMRIYYNRSCDLDAYYSPAFPTSDSKCSLPFNRVDIHADGSIFLCMEGYKIGDLSQESLGQAWHSERAEYFRKTYSTCGSFPMCFRCCGIYDTIDFAEAGSTVGGSAESKV